MSYWNIDSADGTSMSEGIQLEHVARKAAQAHANRLGVSVYLYEAGDGAEETEAEEIAPEDSDES